MTKLCECCGQRTANRAPYEDNAGAEWRWIKAYNITCWHEAFDASGHNYTLAMEAFFDRVRARRAAQATPVEDRPIQAGDWVECVESCGTPTDGTSPGQRFAVSKVTTFFDVPGFELNGRQGVWLASRFKRVDGPHPQDSSGSAGTGAGNHPDLAPSDAGRRKPAQPDETDDPYTAHSLQNDLLTHAENDRRVALAMQEDDEGGPQAKARARNEAALRREAERPRLTADARELAKPHPWEMFE